MAGGSSLREFQQRLAARLSQAHKGQVASHLAVEVGARRLLLPLAESGEIASHLSVQPLPHAKPWFLGVTVLRGQVVGVVDLAVMLGEKAQPSATGTFIALSEALEVNCLLRVDRLAGLRGLEQFSPAGAGDASRGGLGRLFKDAQAVVWEELSLAQLARDEQFLQVYS
ncbi:MAG: chemotaxis protein CheW [Betaproteobacteria bacterium]|nr:chemotaxis protein CheW [Betaproteobacteria bacterium]MDE2047141.1 chemotaxis protein CheW [Betaproteobacteria bacterium]